MENERLVDLHAGKRIYAESLDEQLDQLKSDTMLKRFAESRKRLDAGGLYTPDAVKKR